MLLDGGALAGGDAIAGETAPDEGRTKARTVVNTQLGLVRLRRITVVTHLEYPWFSRRDGHVGNDRNVI